MALLGLLAGAGLKLLKKKLSHKGGRAPSGMAPQEEQDLGFDNVPEHAAGGGGVPALAGPGLGVITTSPEYVQRGKCPRGYSFITTGVRGAGLPTLSHGVAGVCVLTKVARAMGLVRRRRGRGISARDLRAALRVQRLVHRLAPKMGVRRHSGGHGYGCRCPRCKH